MKPKVDPSAYVAPTAVIVGDVTVEEGVSIWDGAVIRGDVSYIKIGKNSNVQDNAVIHVSHNTPTIIGENVTIGHLAMVHAAKIEDNVIIGINSVVLDNAVIGEGSIVGAGAVVTSSTKIPPNSLVLGIPAKVIKRGEDIRKMAVENGLVYQKLRDEHKAGKYGRYKV